MNTTAAPGSIPNHLAWSIVSTIEGIGSMTTRLVAG